MTSCAAWPLMAIGIDIDCQATASESRSGNQAKFHAFRSVKSPTQNAEFVPEVLRRLISVTVTPVGRKPKAKDETDYLLSNPANAKALPDAIKQLERGEGQQHDLLEV